VARRWAILPALALIRAYQWTLSPLLGRQCRFHPTCSWYAADALRAHGLVRGVSLAARRVLRCHPFARGGYDPVPPASAHESGAPTAGARESSPDRA
jgi:putative membrane protein insertion efficiency factor